MNWELPDVQAGFRKGRETIKLPTFNGSYRKQENSRNTSTFASLTMLKPLNVWITMNCGKFLRSWEYQTILPASCGTCMQVQKQRLELDIEQWTCSNLGKKYIKAVYCNPAYFTYMHSTSWEVPGWMNHKLESRLSGKISTVSNTQMIPLWWQKVKRN